MKQIFALFALLFCFLPAQAQQAKELKTTKGIAIAVANLVARRPDCSIGTVSVPSFADAPKHGTMQLAVAILSMPAAGNCPVVRIPVVSIVYVPLPDFVGSDAIRIEIPEGNKTTSLSYRIVVQEVSGDKL